MKKSGREPERRRLEGQGQSGRRAVHRPHRPVGLGQVSGDPRAGGSRLLLRRQPADDAHPDAGEALAARRRRHREGRHRRRRAGGRAFSRRSRRFSSKLRKMPRLNPILIFLEASHAALVRRFSETRRPHPLAPDRSVSEGHPRRASAAEPDPRHGRRDRRHLGHDGPRAAALLHGAVAGSRAGRGSSSRCSASASSTAFRSMPI